jgi:Protein of unknown function (DUF3040)
MSSRDSRLSAEERAALAHLEAAASADDPHLASRLRGSGVNRISLLTSGIRRDLVSLGRRLVALGWWGSLLALVGLALIILAVSVGAWLALAGALILIVGLVSVVGAAERKLVKARSKQTKGAQEL